VKRHVLELVGAILLCLAAYIGLSMRVPMPSPLIGTRSGLAWNPGPWSPDFVALPTLRIRWPQFPNLCVGLCTNEEYPQ